MSRRAPLFATLRRRKTAIARLLVPLLACVWVNASASACLAMAAEAFVAATTGSESEFEHVHAHAPTGIESTSQAATAGEHDACPHCPASMAGHEALSEHPACAVSAEPIGPGSTKPGSQVEPSPPVATANAPPASSPSRQRSVPRASAAGPPYARIPLNLRHCVFLI